MLSVVSCGPAQSTQGYDTPDENLGQVHAEVLGSVTTPMSGCSTAEQAIITNFSYYARIAVASHAFAECMNAQASSYISCQADPSNGMTTGTTYSRSVNSLTFSCDTGSNGNASASLGTAGNYSSEVIAWHNWLPSQVVAQLGDLSTTSDDVKRFSPFPWPWTQGSGEVVHEALHQQSYNHWPGNTTSFGSCNPVSGVSSTSCVSNAGCPSPQVCVSPAHPSGGTVDSGQTGICATYNQFQNSMNYIAQNCVSQVVSLSERNCNLCPTRSADDISSCSADGWLNMIDHFTPAADGTFSCSRHFDPQRGAIGLLFGGSDPNDLPFRAYGMLPHGRRFGGGTGWKSGVGDQLVGSGFFARSAGTDAGDQLVLRSSWGLGVVGMNADGTFESIAMVPFGTALRSNAASWTLQSSDVVVATGRVIGNNPFAPSGVDGIVLHGQGGFAFLAVDQGSLNVFQVVSGHVPGPNGTYWAVGGDDQVVGSGDLNGDGIKDLILKSGWGFGVLSCNGTFGNPSMLDLHAYGDPMGGWHQGSGDQVLSVANFQMASTSDTTEEFLIRSGWGVGLIGFQGGSRLTASWLASFGTVINGWTLSSGDTFPGAGPVVGTMGELIRGSAGIAILSFDSSGTTPSIGNNIAYGQRIGGRWKLGSADVISGFGVYTFGGMGFAISSTWGFGIIELAATSPPQFVTLADVPWGCGGTRSCHGSLFGDWLAHNDDIVAGVVKRSAGGNFLVLQSTP